MFYHRTALEGKSAERILYPGGGLYAGSEIFQEVWQSFTGEGRTPTEFDIGPSGQLRTERTAGLYRAGFGTDRYRAGKQFTDGHAEDAIPLPSGF